MSSYVFESQAYIDTGGNSSHFQQKCHLWILLWKIEYDVYICIYIYIISVKLTSYSTPGSYSAEPLIKVQMQQGLPFFKYII